MKILVKSIFDQQQAERKHAGREPREFKTK